MAADLPPAADPALALFAGDWTGTGRVRGKPVSYTARGEIILAGKFLELALREVSPEPGYEARLSLGVDEKNGGFVVHWLDIFGAEPSRTLGEGTMQDGKLIIHYDYPDGHFRNTFAIRPDGSGWTLFIEAQDGTGPWGEFAWYEFTRAPGAGR